MYKNIFDLQRFAEDSTTTLENIDTYTLNGITITTTKANTEVILSGDDSISFYGDSGIIFNGSDNFKIDNGSFTFKSGNTSFTAVPKTYTTLQLRTDVEGITYINFAEPVTFDIESDSDLDGTLTIEGIISYKPDTNTFGLISSDNTNYEGESSAQINISGISLKVETASSTIVSSISVSDDGKLIINYPLEQYNTSKVTISRDDVNVISNTLSVNGSIVISPSIQEVSLTKDTTLTVIQNGKEVQITALDDAGGKLTFDNNILHFIANEDDGALELNFVTTKRKATMNVTGEIIFGNDGKISLANGTEVNFAWEDGVNLKLTSTGSTGSIVLDGKGIKINSEDENLSIELTNATGDQTQLKGIQGTIYYNAGTVSFEDNSTITATTTLGGEPVLMTLETIGGTGHIEFASNGVIYSADTGAMQITWTKDNVESTFVVNSGSVQIGHNLFKITEGTDLATDLKDFVPALYFTTSDAGTYTINGRRITTIAENIAMTATDDYMTFETSSDAVYYEGMSFVGSGKVSLSSAGVALGAGVVATGFDDGESFMLAEVGNVTTDSRIFKVDDMDTEIPIPLLITVNGSDGGFTFSRKLTKESEAWIDDSLTSELFENYTSPYIGQIYTEEVVIKGDDSYTVTTDAVGLEEIIGISDGATVSGGAILETDINMNVFNIVTDSEGTFVVKSKDEGVERVYNISGDDKVTIRARFDDFNSAYPNRIANLNGTISGDFTGGAFRINDSDFLTLSADTDISISANDTRYKIWGFDEGASLQVSESGTYTINSTVIKAEKDDIITNQNNQIFIEGKVHSIVGADGSTTIIGSPTDDTIYAGAGKTTIIGSGGNDVLVGNDQTTFIIAGEKLEFTNSAVTLKTSDEGYEVYDEGKKTADEAKANLLEYNSDARVLSADDFLAILDSDTQESYWNGDMFVELPTLEADYYLKSNNNIHTGRKVTFINKALSVDEHFNDEGNNAAIVGNDAEGTMLLTAGSGGDSLINYSTASTVSMTGGSGDDYIVAAGGTNETIDISAGGEDTIVAINGASIKGYDINEGIVFKMNFASTESVIDAIMKGGLYVNSNYFGPSRDKRVNLIDFDSNKGTFAKFQTLDDNEQLFGWSSQSGSNVDASDFSDNLILFGMAPDGYSTLKGGSGNDTIYAGTGDKIILTTGSDLININHSYKTHGETVIDLSNISEDVNTTINGYNSGDVIAFPNTLTGYDFNYLNPSTLHITHSAVNDGRNTITGFGFGDNDTADTYFVGDTLDTLALDGHGNLQVNDMLIKNANNKIIKANYADKDWTTTFGDNLIYNKDVNLYGSDSPTTLNVDSTYTDSSAAILLDGSDGKVYYNVKDVNASNYTGDSTLVGNDMDNILTASQGNSSLWGGSGDDTLIGNTGYDEFHYSAGGGNDRLKNVESSDVVKLLDISLDDISSVDMNLFGVSANFKDGGSLTTRNFNNMTFELADGSRWTTDRKARTFVKA